MLSLIALIQPDNEMGRQDHLSSSQEVCSSSNLKFARKGLEKHLVTVTPKYLKDFINN